MKLRFPIDLGPLHRASVRVSLLGLGAMLIVVAVPAWASEGIAKGDERTILIAIVSVIGSIVALLGTIVGVIRSWIRRIEIRTAPPGVAPQRLQLGDLRHLLAGASPDDVADLRRRFEEDVVELRRRIDQMAGAAEAERNATGDRMLRIEGRMHRLEESIADLAGLAAEQLKRSDDVSGQVKAMVAGFVVLNTRIEQTNRSVETGLSTMRDVIASVRPLPSNGGA